ncbi:hypothetical protein DYB32_007898 [Aphanomyces invadans]|uniref:Tubby C-terminal domain-containing protein n=1 Tax=Aphanomyces invadans TaxID=157072 RepID=A0A3R6VHI4_9STRA|nr:hypothetical protein DYB32_007898 [Aphanomyces invadans]
MAQRAAPLSSSRHSNQKGFFKEDERKMTSASSQAKSQKPGTQHCTLHEHNPIPIRFLAWQASALTATDQGENQVIPFSFDEEDDERDEAGAKEGHPSDSEHDEGSGSDSESQNKLVLLAQKQLHNRTSNYHIFDMSRGGYAGQKLTKKSGNYVGKLRSNFGKHENVMVSAQAERSELGAIHFDTKVSSTKVLLIAAFALLAQGAKPESFSTLLDLHKADKRGTDHLTVLENKEPEYEKGCYRLNFNGRVSIPSVKNFQLIARGNAAKGIVLQFGKVSDKLFHLDFKHPLTPFQAFAIALSQFNY